MVNLISQCAPRFRVRQFPVRFVGALLFFTALSSSPLALSWGGEQPKFDQKKVEFYEKRIRPLLIDNCYNCHSADSGGRGGLRVDDRNGLIEGGGRGPGVVPGDPVNSLLLKAVRHQNGLEMPPKKQLSDEQIADLEQWIRDGAAWPPVEVPSDLVAPKPEYEQLRREHWAWQPLRQSPPPQITDDSFSYCDIDRFVQAKWIENGLKPVGDSDKRALIRRVTFDLTGLPPTTEEIASFLNDANPNPFERVVDRLLNSSAYGERWARHWLDVARYGESTGSARNLPMPHAWRYRDYVINAFTNDMPYDKFVREQIAGDLLPANSPAEKADQLIATGFLAIGVKDVNQRFKVRFTMDNIDEQIDAVSRSLLALTVSCARCHDHKFDPIPTADYYALAGIFHSSDLCAGLRSKMGGGGFDYYDTAMLLRVGFDSSPDAETVRKIDEQRAAIATARAELDALREKPAETATGTNGQSHEQAARQKLTKAERELFILTDPALYSPIAYGVRDAVKTGDTQIRIRGEAEQLGPTVQRGFLSVISYPDQPKINTRQSGRLELAEWLTSEHNPLAQRVIVNRVWRHLFDQGLVTTVDNFGINGDRPSHPELLDFLSRQFVQNGWSIKKLVRSIVLSHSYQLSAETSAANFAFDPSNRFLWRHRPRRLEAEEIRDAMLAVSGRLNRQRPEASPAKTLKVVEMTNNGPEAKRLTEDAANNVYRSIYLPLVRGVTPRSLEVFDFAEQGLVTGSREATTVPTQALYLLNDPFVRGQATAFAERTLQKNQSDATVLIQSAYEIAFGRPATPTETDRAIDYLAAYEVSTREQLLAAQIASTLPTESTGATDAASSSPNADASPEKPKPAEPVLTDKVVSATDPRIAAWTSFCQALFIAAEFRYLK